MADSGILYVLTNPAMPGLVKIGFTTKSVKERLRALNGATGVPLRFECYFAAKVPSMSKKERILHTLFDENRINAKKEFFEIDPERVILAIKMGPFKDVTPAKATLKPVDAAALEEAKKRNEKRADHFRFDIAGIPVGATLKFTRDENIRATVEPNNKVKYGRDTVSISGAAKRALKTVGIHWEHVQGPMYWLYKGKTLTEIRRDKGF